MLWLWACSVDPVADQSAANPPTATLENSQYVAIVGEALSLNAGSSEGDAFAWHFGDGTTLSGASVEYTPTSTGRTSLKLTVSTEDGRSDSASGTVVAVNSPLANPPNRSTRLAWMDEVLYLVIPDIPEVIVVRDNQVTARWPACGQPVALSVSGGRVAVACADDEVQVFAADGSLQAAWTTAWGSRPVGIAWDAVGETVWVALAGDAALEQFSAEGESLASAPAADAHAVATSGDTAFVSRFRSPDSEGQISRVNQADVSVFGLAKDPGPDSDTDARGLPTLLAALAVSPDGREIAVGGAKANIERGLQRDGLPYTFETATRSTLRLIQSDTGGSIERSFFDNRDTVGALTYSPRGELLLVAHQGAGAVDILDPFTLTRLGGFQEVGVGLDGIATDGSTVWVLATWDRELVAYDLSNLSAEVELARIPLVENEPLSAEVLAGGRIFHFAGDPRMSKDGYLSCASCHPAGDQDGRTWDFTDRGEGFRNTQPLWAMPTAGPFHWSANFDELQDFEAAIRAHQAGTGFMTDDDFAVVGEPLGPEKAGISAELDALAAYMQSIVGQVPRSPFRGSDGSMTEAGARGEAVFAIGGCAACHSGVEGTDAGWNEDGSPVLHDVGTLLETSGGRLGGVLSGLRTPSLRGLHASAPYLHDGRAPTLEAALEAHGVSLSPDETSDLVAYLLQIED